MNYIAIRKEPNGSLYMDKSFFLRYTDNDLERYNYTKVAVKKDYFPTITEYDFNKDTLQFDEATYLARIAKEAELSKLPELQIRLNQLSEDIVQIQCGAVFEDAEARKAEFREIHNEIRRIIGKAPRTYSTSAESLDTSTNIVL